MISLEDIASARFRVAPRGYHIPDVDQFLNVLAARVGEGAGTSPMPEQESPLADEVQRLSRLLEQSRAENERLRSLLEVQRIVEPGAARAQQPMSALELAFEHMSAPPDALHSPTQRDEGVAVEDWSPSTTTESTLDTSLFDGGANDD